MVWRCTEVKIYNRPLVSLNITYDLSPNKQNQTLILSLQYWSDVYQSFKPYNSEKYAVMLFHVSARAFWNKREYTLNVKFCKDFVTQKMNETQKDISNVKKILWNKAHKQNNIIEFYSPLPKKGYVWETQDHLKRK